MKRLIKNTNLGIGGLALGYFLFYVPYSAMTKALSKGLLPGREGPISGFEMLPTVVIGTLIMFLILITINGWWKYATFYKFGPIKIPFASNRWTVFSGIAAAFIIITTTLAYSFTGISIVFAALLMRGGVLVMSPVIDTIFKRKVNWYSWVALGLSITALLIIFSEKGGYVLSIAAGINIGAYLLGYVFRLQFMTYTAKSTEKETNYRYFVEEMLVAGVAIVAIPGVLALVGNGGIFTSFQLGFTTFISSALALPALVIGALYACLYIFGTRIYLDKRENTYCIPFNRCASLLAGVVAAGLLTIFFEGIYVSTYQLLSSGILMMAVLVLSYPMLRTKAQQQLDLIQQYFVFVCPGNTGRSPMAQAICQAEILDLLKKESIDRSKTAINVLSAGLNVEAERPINEHAKKALESLGVPILPHKSKRLTIEQVAQADRIYCMSIEHFQLIKEKFPEAEGKLIRLDPKDNIPVPHGKGFNAYYNCAAYLQKLIKRNLQEDHAQGLLAIA